MIRRLALIVNPRASGGDVRNVVGLAARELERARAPFRVVESRDLGHARLAAGTAASAGETVVAVGGDGLVGPLAGVLRGSDAALAILPAGRGNDFARVVGIPRDPAAAARVAIEGEEKLLDVGEVNGVAFVGIASVGFDSDANRIANDSRLVRGRLVYLYAALRALAGWRHACFRVTVDGETRQFSGYSVAVANSKAYGGGMYLAPHAELDDGRLDVLMVEHSGKLRFLRSLPKIFKGTHLEEPTVQFESGRRVEVSADRSFVVYADGDPVAELPVAVSVASRVLRVVVPASAGK